MFSIFKSSGLVGRTPKYGVPPNLPFKRKGREKREEREREMWRDVEGEINVERESEMWKEMWRERQLWRDRNVERGGGGVPPARREDRPLVRVLS